MLAAFLVIGGLPAASAQDAQGAQAQVQAQAAEIGAAARRYPPGSIKTVEEADRALADAGRERDAVLARHAREEQRCSPKFFSSSCLEDANEARRKALRELRSVEVEANKVKRQATAASRDAALAEKREKEGASRAERDAAARESAGAAPIHGSGPAEVAAPASSSAPSPAATPASAPIAKPLPSGKPSGVDRVAEHEEKMRAIREREAAEADKRARNIASYERKVQESEARQREVAKRKEEKARKLEEKRQRAAQQEAK